MTALAVPLALVHVVAVWAVQDGSDARRVRHNGDGLISGLIEEGVHRSATFRALVDTIGAGDGLVYVEQGECGRGVRACLVHRVYLVGPYRMLRVLVKAMRGRAELIGAIGHELQHAVEVLADPAIRTSQDMFFQHMSGMTMGATRRFETAEAVRIGAQIEHEVRTRR